MWRPRRCRSSRCPSTGPICCWAGAPARCMPGHRMGGSDSISTAAPPSRWSITARSPRPRWAPRASSRAPRRPPRRLASAAWNWWSPVLSCCTPRPRCPPAAAAAGAPRTACTGSRGPSGSSGPFSGASSASRPRGFGRSIRRRRRPSSPQCWRCSSRARGRPRWTSTPARGCSRPSSASGSARPGRCWAWSPRAAQSPTPRPIWVICRRPRCWAARSTRSPSRAWARKPGARSTSSCSIRPARAPVRR
jgi:hypothetical protein